ncbi:hypothetical protein AB0I30_23180 [Nocardia tengchongensis]|uniref:hypothetical protein n=1 Tax=Nocardia tengchongensis TaxID=2055889 RepID=UPI0033D09B42
MRELGELGSLAPFQLMIVDNAPPRIRGVRKVHRLDYNDGFLKNLDLCNADDDEKKSA